LEIQLEHSKIILWDFNKNLRFTKKFFFLLSTQDFHWEQDKKKASWGASIYNGTLLEGRGSWYMALGYTHGRVGEGGFDHYVRISTE
jgi:hypothetical protein